MKRLTTICTVLMLFCNHIMAGDVVTLYGNPEIKGKENQNIHISDYNMKCSIDAAKSYFDQMWHRETATPEEGSPIFDNNEDELNHK